MESASLTPRQFANVLIGIFITAVVAIGITVALLNDLGLLDTEIVIFIPLAVGLTGFVLIMIFALALASRKQLFVSVAPLEGASYDPRDMESEAFYTIPMYCPHCKDKIDLQRIHWLDKLTLVCQNCMGKVAAKVSEDD